MLMDLHVECIVGEDNQYLIYVSIKQCIGPFHLFRISEQRGKKSCLLFDSSILENRFSGK